MQWSESVSMNIGLYLPRDWINLSNIQSDVDRVLMTYEKMIVMCWPFTIPVPYLRDVLSVKESSAGQFE